MFQFSRIASIPQLSALLLLGGGGMAHGQAFLSLTGTFSNSSQILTVVTTPTSNSTFLEVVRTYGSTGGVNKASVSVAGGGHDSVITVFDSVGNQLAANDDANGLGGVTGLDSYIGPFGSGTALLGALSAGSTAVRLNTFSNSLQNGAFALDISTAASYQYAAPQLPVGGTIHRMAVGSGFTNLNSTLVIAPTDIITVGANASVLGNGKMIVRGSLSAAFLEIGRFSFSTQPSTTVFELDGGQAFAATINVLNPPAQPTAVAIKSGTLTSSGSITIGGDGTITFEQTGGAVAAQTVNIRTTGSAPTNYNLRNGSFTANNLLFTTNGGLPRFTQTGGAVSIANLVQVGGTVGVSEYRQLGGAVQAGSIAINTNGRFILDSGTLTTGTISVAGGVFQWDSGALALGGDLSVGDFGALFNGIDIVANKRLDVAGALSIAPFKTVTMSGGRLSVGTLSPAAGAVFAWNSGTVEFTGGEGLIIGAAGPLGSTYAAGPARTLSVVNTLTNQGLIRGNGNIAAGTLLNTGEVRVSTGEQLRITAPSTGTGGALNNLGQINLLGGLLETQSSLENAVTGRINGRGTIKADAAFINDGTISLSAGVSDVFGNVTQSSSGKTIVTGLGNATFYDNVTNQAGSEFRVSSGSVATFFGTVSGLSQFTGTGTTNFEGPASFGRIAKGGSSYVGPAGTLNAEAIIDGNLIVEGEASIVPNGTNAGTSRLEKLSILPGGRFDLANNDMIIDYTGASPLTTIRGYLLTGRNGGNWLGNGLTSSAAAGSLSTALGFAEASEIGSPATFFGQPIDATTLLTRYTLIGDADLSGAVSLDDFTALAASFGQPNSRWSRGDFNYDGFTNLDDFTALAANFGLNLPADLPRGAAVPEPTVWLVSIALAGLTSRSRRRRR